MTQVNYDYTEDDAREVKQLIDNPDVDEVIVLGCASERIWSNLKHVCSRAETTRVRGQLEMINPRYRFTRVFRSFLVQYNEDGIIDEVWGSLSEVPWPDSYIFRLV